ncbi:hypothetical protein DL766_003051 [Monosporascus sp. MC13-8B]|uniref:RGS domain-containing protein n=1 Tax=Monosporascus cannonballus TaxID=155416 RepID=A0ABY0HB81_9PEZI|nr:hypothetical protein DL762_004696 [Monosporascus cannonballus]RYO98747.1 hypothetical protein DL763_002008 [Monosporascus cannonballus]RYP34402.1 hypothetical protein DL766_003051 [Monosporascus sp. MC13-8B]
MESSRPSSMAIPRAASPILKAPPLSDILSNTAPPPWTLGAFMAYLSQNHCLETLEFVLDADRYRTAHGHLAQSCRTLGVEDGTRRICSLWRKIIDAYIMPCAPREVNLPAPVRDRLLELRCTSSGPPDPSELDEAVQIVHELMNDSVLVPFLESVTPAMTESRVDEDIQDSRQGRSRLRIPRDATSSVDEASQSPKAAFLPLLGINRGAGHRPRSTSTDFTEVGLATDDSSSPNSTPAIEPITPPTTPPTSDVTLGGSPNTFQKAISGNGWKKMGARLGFSRKNKSISRTNQGSASTTPEMDPIRTSEPAINRPPL